MCFAFHRSPFHIPKRCTEIMQTLFLQVSHVRTSFVRWCITLTGSVTDSSICFQHFGVEVFGIASLLGRSVEPDTAFVTLEYTLAYITARLVRNVPYETAASTFRSCQRPTSRHWAPGVNGRMSDHNNSHNYSSARYQTGSSRNNL
jgi:hypothetical protein